MTLTDRDRKLVILLVPVLVLVGYWFLLLAPKRHEASNLGDQLSKQEAKRDKVQAQLARLNAAQENFAEDYATVVKLGKAVPTTVDMPSLIVQLSSAAKGTGISFERIKAGPRQSASQDSGTAGGSSSGSGSTGSGTPASAAGGQKAGTSAGSAAEKANNTKAAGDQQAAQTSASGSGSSSSSSSSSTSSSTSAAGGAPASPSIPGLDSVPLEFTFRGGFFNLTRFFHQLKRFVRVANERIAVRGRLMTIDGFTFKTSVFPRLEAQVFATVYLTPKTEGATAGATPGGPSQTPANGQSTPAASGSSPAPSTPPAAVRTP